MLLMIDNYDSFTYNLVQYFGELGEDVRVFRNDEITLEGIAELRPQRLVLSPGPCSPAEAGICVDAIRALHRQAADPRRVPRTPGIGAALGGRIVRAQRLMHGKLSRISTDQQGLYAGLPKAVRRRALPLAGDRARDAARRARCHVDVGRRRDHGRAAPGAGRQSAPLEGVQFHPESILSEHGHAMLRNFLQLH